jgi:quercetin dioxygenase-like cupin family protein
MKEVPGAYAIKGFLTHSGGLARTGHDAAGGSGFGSGGRLACFVRATAGRPGGQAIPGREIVQVETLIPAGVESGWHAHPGEEVGYIIVGQVEMMVQGRANAVLHAGDGFLIPPRTPHNARDLGPETGRMLSTYIVEIDQPVATFVDPPVQR